MKKKVLAIVFPVVLAVVCSLAVWANDQVQPGCANCAKSQQSEGKGCCAKKAQAQQAEKKDVQPEAKPHCDKCKQAGEAGAKAQDQAEVKPCCEKKKAEVQAASKGGCCNKK